MAEVGKPRGGASCACPRTLNVTAARRMKNRKPPVQCGEDSRVLETRRKPGGIVWRKRVCTKGHVFTTEEKASDKD